MLQQGHESDVSIDSTFGTKAMGFELDLDMIYGLMFFESPLKYIICCCNFRYTQ
jgi:hypothetical protein